MLKLILTYQLRHKSNRKYKLSYHFARNSSGFRIAFRLMKKFSFKQ